ncbi:MAG: biotin--[acetyl-CoA-carboxylase] ligase [Bacteroidota bacterium]
MRYTATPQTKFIGQHVLHKPSCASTSSWAATCLDQGGVPAGTVFITDHQYQGRGQRGRVWHSAPSQNLTFSIVLYPTFLTATQGFALSMLTVLALRQVLTAYIPDGLMAKWPNDLYYRDQKLGGILIENRIVHRHLSASIIGIGLNVNQIHFEEARPTSLALICGRKFQLAPLLTKFLETLEEGYAALQRHGWAPLQATYLRYLYWRAEVHTFDYQGQRFQGTIHGIDALGRLEIVCLDGTTRCYSMQEVRFVA